MTDTMPVLLLTIALFMATVAVTVLASTLPYLWRRAFQLEERVQQLRTDVNTLDTTLSKFLEVAGVPAEKAK